MPTKEKISNIFFFDFFIKNQTIPSPTHLRSIHPSLEESDAYKRKDK